MFDLGASELLLIVIVAIIVIGPKELPLGMRTAGRWAGKVRRVSGHFRSGIDTMIREADMEDMEKSWKERNEAIMKEHPDTPQMEMEETAPPASGAEAAASGPKPPKTDDGADPQLPLPPP